MQQVPPPDSILSWPQMGYHVQALFFCTLILMQTAEGTALYKTPDSKTLCMNLNPSYIPEPWKIKGQPPKINTVCLQIQQHIKFCIQNAQQLSKIGDTQCSSFKTQALIMVTSKAVHIWMQLEA